MKIIHLILLGLVGSTGAKKVNFRNFLARANVTGKTAERDLYGILEDFFDQIEQKTTTVVSGPAVDVKKPGAANEIWNLNGFFVLEGDTGELKLTIKFADCWEGAFTGTNNTLLV